MDITITSLSILILEDHPFQRMVAEQTVSGLNVGTLFTAQSSEEALTFLQNTGAVDIVICDLDMPGMDGIQLIRHLAEQKLARGVIVLSAMEAALVRIVGDMAQAHGLVVLGHIPKPMSRTRLRELLEFYCSQQAENKACPVTSRELIFDEDTLEKAIDDNQFVLYYQPKVLLKSGRMISVEALTRWHHPQVGVISPVHFIPMMESSGLIAPMTTKMIELALDQIRIWRAQERNIAVGINLSAAVLTNTNLPDMLIGKMRDLSIPPELLTLEITESSLIQNAALSLETLARLKLNGFSLSIDDFGTGYSSMQQLNRIPFSELKIDRSFVSNACNDKAHKAIVEANISLAHKLNMQTVAEGVETLESWQLLNELNCDQAQGYFIARPMPADEIPRWEQEWLARQPIIPPKPCIREMR
ncbi:EAL domain-containing protein [Endozoicomonas sp. SESOKO1]|uniref:GGDEF/EAL domain-containing response regulator n=1 Tax=Endozoicomonas sp. SESOKO1 TaxID=2828742 RepID=UPI0021483DEF|nr:EAL domain-containing response regulator [Endozoicomonas sp. SESOKO1]